MVKVKCLNPIASCGLDLFDDNYEVVEEYNEAEVVLVRSASMHELDLPDSLMAVARAGAGVNNIPLDKCAEKGIVVFNTPGANANSVKELVIGSMIVAARNVDGGIEYVKSIADDPDIAKTVEKGKKNYVGTEIAGKKLAVLGLGAIGYRVANAAVAMGMDVYGYDPYLSNASAWNISHHVHHCNKMEEALLNADYVTIHVPAIESTKGTLNKNTLALLADKAIVLNFARDTLVVNEDIKAALESGKIAKYVTDFAVPEIMGVKNVICTPHLGASTGEAEDNCAVMAVKEIREYIENGNIIHSVNYPDCDLGAATKASRIAIFHHNKPTIISKFTTIAGEAGINIDDMICKSKGDYAYALFDLSTPVNAELVSKIEAVEGVIKVRVVK